MPRIAEGMRMDEFVILQLMGMVEQVRGRKKECVHEYKDDSGIFSKPYHSSGAKVRKKWKCFKYDKIQYFRLYLRDL